MIKTKNNYENLTYLNSYISKVLKRNFGKGPATCNTSLTDDRMFIYIKHFITPVEEVLVKNNQGNLAYKTRSVILETIFKEIKDEIDQVLGIAFTTMHHDWNYNKNSGLLMLVKESDSLKLDHFTPRSDDTYMNIEKIFSEVHKKPKEIMIVNATSSIYYIEYSGFMIQIERALYNKGCDDLLIERNKEVKNIYEKNKRLFEKDLKRSINDIFFIPDYQQDKGTIVFM
jgi:uncharacterized protein YbcI